MSKHAERLRREAQELRAGRKPEAEERNPATMTPAELDRAVENQRAEVQRLKERELQAAREATKPRLASTIADLNTASRRRRMFK